MEGFFCRWSFLEASGKTGDISDKSVVGKDERPAGEPSLDGNQNVVAIDSKIFALDCFDGNNSLSSRFRI